MGKTTEKLNAAIKAIEFIQSGMVVGLGSGSTSELMIELLGNEVSKGLSIKGIPSSKKSEILALQFGIPLISLNESTHIDINIDGADEFTEGLQLIKGGGGALLREKIIAHYSKLNVIIVDSTKKSQSLGNFKLPVEVVPFSEQKIMQELIELNLSPKLREVKGSMYKTDQNNSILDLDIRTWDNLEHLENMLQKIPGIVETGFFLNSTDLIIMGENNGIIEYKKDLQV